MKGVSTPAARTFSTMAACGLITMRSKTSSARPSAQLSNSLRAWAPALACMALVEHSFRLDLASTGHTIAALRQAAAVLRHAPAFTLAYPRDYAANGMLLDTLATHLANLPNPMSEPA